MEGAIIKILFRELGTNIVDEVCRQRQQFVGNSIPSQYLLFCGTTTPGVCWCCGRFSEECLTIDQCSIAYSNSEKTDNVRRSYDVRPLWVILPDPAESLGHRAILLYTTKKPWAHKRKLSETLASSISLTTYLKMPPHL